MANISNAYAETTLQILTIYLKSEKPFVLAQNGKSICRYVLKKIWNQNL